MRRTLFTCLLIFSSALFSRPSLAQGVFLPPAFGNWTISESSPLQPVTLEQAAGANAAFVREYGFEAIEHHDYSRTSDKGTLGVTLYRMIDPTAAYGAFTFLRPAAMPSSKLTQYAAVSPDHALIVVGNFLLDVRGASLSSPDSELDALVSSLKRKADPRPFPIIVEHLPPQGLVPGSEHYFSGPTALHELLPVADGDWLGFAQGGEAVLARYRKGGQEVTLLIAEYPTQQLAASHFGKMSAIINAAASDGANQTPHVVASRREAGLIGLVFAPKPSPYADSLPGQIIFGHNVVWNEPQFKAKDLPWSAYVIGSFLGSGVIMLFAFVSGLGFAVIRLIVKRFFPGKVFDRHRSMEVLQMGLSGRRVNTKDFY